MADEVGRRGAPSPDEPEQSPAESRSRRGRAWDEPTSRHATPGHRGRFADEWDDEPTGRFALDDDNPDDEPPGRFALDDDDRDDEPTGRFAAIPAPVDPISPRGRFARREDTEDDPVHSRPARGALGRFASTAEQDDADLSDDEPTGRYGFLEAELQGRFASAPDEDEPTGRFAIGSRALRDLNDDPQPGPGRHASPDADDPPAEAATGMPIPEPGALAPTGAPTPTTVEAVQPAFSGLTPPPATSPVEPESQPSPDPVIETAQGGPALFSWDQLTPRTTTSQTMTPTPATPVAPTSPVTLGPTAEDSQDASPPETVQAEVPWQPSPSEEPEPVVATGGSGGGARHGSPSSPSGDDNAPRRRWVAVAVLGVVLAVVIGALYLYFGDSPETASPGPDAPTTSSQVSASPGTPGATPTGSTAPEPTESQAPGSADPSGTPGGQPATSPSATATPAPSTPATPSPVVLDLTDAQVTVLPGWQLYADEVVQENRRLIRIKQLATDTRIQIVTLPGITGPLTDACTDLVNDHRGSYSNVAASLAVSVPVATGAEGIACSFTGTRTSDNVPTRVDFTIVRRDSDAMSLVFRDTRPQEVPADSPALAELVRIECAAADSFGVTISQCASATPVQGGG